MIKIEVYKKQEIRYDEDSDKFVCEIEKDGNTKETKRQSLKDVRKAIDVFMKDNANFKPFKLFKKANYSTDLEGVNIEGLRSDGKFVASSLERNRMSKEILSKKEFIDGYYEYYEYSPDIVAENKRIDEEETKYRDIISKKRKSLVEKLVKFDASDYDLQ